MKKSTRIIIVLLCIFVVGLTFFLIFDMQKKIQQNKSNNLSEKNNSENSIVNNTLNNVVNQTNIVNENNVVDSENTVINDENIIDNNTTVDSNVNTNTENENNDVTGNYSLDEVYQDRAIELVKERWGKEDNSVYYTNEGKNEEGNYLVAVRSKEDTSILSSFKVDLNSEKVQIDL